jgi:hypothetical protein
MVRSFVEAILGEVGRQILYFYEAHALPINMLVLTYGTIMIMCWLTLARIYRHLVILVAKEIHLNPKVTKDSSVKAIKKAVEIPWQAAVDAARFPLISSQAALIPARKSVAAVQKLLTAEEIIAHAVAVLNGKENPRKVFPRFKSVAEREKAKKAREKEKDSSDSE